MNIQKFTQKSLEAIQSAQTEAVQEAQNLAVQNQNAQIEEEHLILALLEQDNSLITELLKKITNEEEFERELKEKIAKMPKITGGARPKDRNICITRCRLDTCKCRNNSKKYEG